MPPMVFSCEASRRTKKAEANQGLFASLTAAIFGAPEVEAPEPGPADPCTDLKTPKKCGRSEDGCVWCEGQWSAGQCFSEVRARARWGGRGVGATEC